MPHECQALVTELAPGGRVATAVRRNDELLMVAKAAVQGSASAIRTLVMHVGPPMLTTVRKILGAHHPEVDDVAQEAVIALLDALSRFREESSVMTFALRVSLLTALAARRKARARDKYIAEAASEPLVPSSTDTPQSLLLAKRRREVLLKLLDGLPEPTAEALALHFVLGMTVEEIADTTSTPVNTVWSRLRLGKQALRRKLSTDDVASALLEETP